MNGELTPTYLETSATATSIQLLKPETGTTAKQQRFISAAASGRVVISLHFYWRYCIDALLNLCNGKAFFFCKGAKHPILKN